MAKRKAAQLPTPSQAIPSTMPVCRTGTYAAIARQSDRYLAKAEEAVRMACLLWADVDAGLETRLEELAQQILADREEAVGMVRDLYGDRLGERAL